MMATDWTQSKAQRQRKDQAKPHLGRISYHCNLNKLKQKWADTRIPVAIAQMKTQQLLHIFGNMQLHSIHQWINTPYLVIPFPFPIIIDFFSLSACRGRHRQIVWCEVATFQTAADRFSIAVTSDDAIVVWCERVNISRFEWHDTSQKSRDYFRIRRIKRLHYIRLLATHLFDFMPHRKPKTTSAWMTILTQYCKIHRILHAAD